VLDSRLDALDDARGFSAAQLARLALKPIDLFLNLSKLSWHRGEE